MTYLSLMSSILEIYLAKNRVYKVVWCNFKKYFMEYLCKTGLLSLFETIEHRGLLPRNSHHNCHWKIAQLVGRKIRNCNASTSTVSYLIVLNTLSKLNSSSPMVEIILSVSPRFVVWFIYFIKIYKYLSTWVFYRCSSWTAISS